MSFEARHPRLLIILSIPLTVAAYMLVAPTGAATVILGGLGLQHLLGH
jgi:hypothetical protein